jgi:hypothetical protein
MDGLRHYLHTHSSTNNALGRACLCKRELHQIYTRHSSTQWAPMNTDDITVESFSPVISYNRLVIYRFLSQQNQVVLQNKQGMESTRNVNKSPLLYTGGAKGIRSVTGERPLRLYSAGSPSLQGGLASKVVSVLQVHRLPPTRYRSVVQYGASNIIHTGPQNDSSLVPIT